MAYQKKTYIKKEIARVGFRPSYKPSVEQEAGFEEFLKTDRNIRFKASAGSGKSTTLVWLMSLIEKNNTPSAFLAFGKDIVKDIEPRCAKNVTVKTAHQYGYVATAKHIGGRLFLMSDKVKNILRKYPFLDPNNELDKKKKSKVYDRLNNASDLVDKLRLNLTNEEDEIAVAAICNKYGIDWDAEVVSIIPDVFRSMLDSGNCIDFTDMLWMPVRLNLPIQQYKMMYVDECQDLSPLSIAYVEKMSSGKIVLCGDLNQSIMSFAGADPQSFNKLGETFNAVDYPLNTCYRCGQDIVKFAQSIVPEIKHWESSPRGVINGIHELDYEMPEGSMILSRRNANLVKPCFKLLKNGKKAIIRGQNIGYGLIDTIKGYKADTCIELIDLVNTATERKLEKLMACSKVNNNAIEMAQDQRDIIVQFAEEVDTVDNIVKRIKAIFSDDVEGIVLSSIHKSKGLEANHVTILDYENVRLNHAKMTDADHLQEKNLNYVAVTRPKLVLDLITKEREG